MCAAVATAKRNNERVAKGFKEDCGKYPARLTAIVKPPFGASKPGTKILVTIDGSRINTDMQVLDAKEQPIPGR